MRARLILSLLLLCLGLLTQHARAQTEPRLALLIGNAAYKSAPLANPVNDVRLMELSLKSAGFTVIKAENASMREMRRLVRDFGDQLKASGGVGLFYFAGHGVQVRGKNFLVSTDSDIRNEDEVADDAINASLVLEKMQSAGNRMNLVILDACRNNPFAVKSRSAANGLATMNAPTGTLVAYATAPGSVASDGSGSNGLYTEHLAQAIMQPGVPVEDVFKQVRSAVRRASNNQQTPWENTALEGQFYFRPGAAVAAAQPAANTTGAGAAGASGDVAVELAFWDAVKNSKNSEELRSYLAQYPNGRFALVAQVRLQSMTAQPSTTAPPKAVAAVLVPRSAWPTRGVVGTMVTTDPYSKVKTSSDVTADDFEPGQIAYSTGDVIDLQGRVLQVLIGNAIAKVTSGALWTIPVKPDAKGEAKVNVNHPGVDNLRGTIRWSSKDMGQNKTQVTAEVAYGGLLDYQFMGKWQAIFSVANPLPDSFSAAIPGARSRASTDTNYGSGEFIPRQ